MPDARYFVERLKAHSDAWMIKFDERSLQEPIRSGALCDRGRRKAQRTRPEGPGRGYRTHVDLRAGHQPRVVVSLAAAATELL
jgi:hypothetical protein